MRGNHHVPHNTAPLCCEGGSSGVTTEGLENRRSTKQSVGIHRAGWRRATAGSLVCPLPQEVSTKCPSQEGPKRSGRSRPYEPSKLMSPGCPPEQSPTGRRSFWKWGPNRARERKWKVKVKVGDGNRVRKQTTGGGVLWSWNTFPKRCLILKT